MRGQSYLAKVVLALAAASRFACRLHRGQQKRHQNADDGNYHQQLNERKASARAAHDDPQVQQDLDLQQP
jgi:hypothetical protein